MSASEKTLSCNAPAVKRLAILAGGGSLPHALLQACDQKNIEVFIVAFEGQAAPDLVTGRKHLWSSPGKAGEIIKTLQKHDFKDLVLAGSIRRPSISELKPDLKTAKLLAEVGLKAMGDNDFLSAIRSALQKEGFHIHGVHKFEEKLLAPDSVMSKAKPKKADWVDIKKGLAVSQSMGALDIGQAVIVQEGLVLAVEAIEGTDELLRRSKDLKRKGRGGVLVKTCKPQQDTDFDLPTIGPDTIHNAAEAGLSGVVVHAGHSLILDREDVVRAADKYKLFLVGLHPDDCMSE